MSFEELFETLREECEKSTWSRAVETTRTASIFVESEENEEIVLIVEIKHLHPAGKSPRKIPFRVRLFPADQDWSCKCNEDDPCRHTVAAAIAYRQAVRKGESLPKRSGGKAGHIGYRLKRRSQGLLLERVVVQDGVETPITVTLTALTMGTVDGPNVEPNAIDRKIETMVGLIHGGPPHRHAMARVIDALSRCGDLQLDGEPVKASSKRSLLHGRIVDHPEGFKLFVEQDPAIVEVFPGGVVLLDGGVLEAVGESPLTGKELEELRRGKVFPKEDATYLATEVIPSLSARIPFEVRTRRLPRVGGRAPLSIQIETGARGDILEVLPLLVYGDPPIARVDSGRLVPLEGVVPVRDVEEERVLCRRLQAELGLDPGRKIERRGAEALELLENLERWHGDVKGNARDVFFRAPPLKPVLAVMGDDFSLEFSVSGGDRGGDGQPLSRAGSEGREAAGRADPSLVFDAWQKGESMVSLEGGGISPLPIGWLKQYGPALADLMAAKEVCSGKLPKAVLPDLARLCADLDMPPPDGFERLKALVESITDSDTTDGDALLPEPLVPDDLVANLRQYQYEGVKWLQFLRDTGLGALLADDMGLGKTLQALCSIRGRTLVVAPASVVYNWADEISKFRPGLSASIYHGAGRVLDNDVSVTITTYAILRLDVDILSQVAWETVILDEAQAIKNPVSQVARAAFRIKGDFRIALTGTPVENRLEELWSQMHFVSPGLLGGRSDFESRYSRPIREGEAGVAARLRSRIRPFVLRRTKNLVAPELPERTDTVLRCSLSESERLVYDAVQAAAKEEVVDRLAAGGSVLDALEALLRMRQAACHSALVPGQEAQSSSKIDLLMETLEEALAEGHKALVFSQWTSLLNLVEPHFERAGISFSRLDGSTRDRAGVVRAFQDEDGPPVMLVSLKAGGTGINLTAADHVFLLDPWWNPAVEEQAASRAHRIGQTRPVMVHRLVAEQTVEEKILGLQAHKRAIFEAALGEAAGSGSTLTRDDLLGLLE